MAFKIDTKRLLADSLSQLAKEKNFRDITVQDIVDHCGAARSTFYRHFHDKYELMCWYYEDFVRSTFLESETHIPWKEKLRYYAEFYMQNKDYFINITAYDGQNSFDQFLYSYSLSHFTRIAKEKYHVHVLPNNIVFAIKMYCYGNSAIVRDWLTGEMNLTIDEFCEYRYESMPVIMKDFLK